MRTHSRKVAFLGAVALAAAGIVATASTASADLSTRCIGTAGAVTVPGELVVPAGRTCVLNGTTVEGQVRVLAGADLVVTDGTFNDRVVVQAGGFFDATGTTIAANIISNGAYGVYLQDVTVGGHYVGRDADVDSSFLYSLDSAVAGRVETVIGDVYLDTTTVGRFVSTEGNTYTDVINSTVGRELTISGTEYGVVICASEVDGATTLLENAGVQVGSGGAIVECDEVNYFGADLTISDNTDGVDVTGNIVRGDLTGEGNDPAPTGSDNRVRGELGGQFADLHPADASLTAQDRPALRSGADGRTPADTLAARDERRSDAVEEAELIGTAGF